MARITVAAVFVALAMARLVQSAAADLLVYEGFDYPNDSANTLVSQTGSGLGWNGNWFDPTGTSSASTYVLSQDDTSLPVSTFPITVSGDRVSGATTVGATPRIFRLLNSTIPTNVESVIYGSFLATKADGGTSSDALELNLMRNTSATATGSATIRVGISSNEEPFAGFDTSSNVAGFTLDTTKTYFFVFKYETHSTGNDVLSVKTYAPGDVVPATDPLAYDVTYSTAVSTALNAVRLSKSPNAAGSIDEIRIGQTWADVAAIVSPQPSGDFDGDGDVDGADFIIWQTNHPAEDGHSLATGDADGDTDVDGADFVAWQDGFPSGSGPGATPIPEPGSLFLAIVGFLVLVECQRRAS
jgi:hypothetical protein